MHLRFSAAGILLAALASPAVIAGSPVPAAVRDNAADGGWNSSAPSRRARRRRDDAGVTEGPSSPSTYCGDYSQPPMFTSGDADWGGPGVLLFDRDFTNTHQEHYYFLYENGQDDHPWKYTRLAPGTTTFISVCPTFAGRIVRGNPSANLDGTALHNLGTWIELAWTSPVPSVPAPNGGGGGGGDDSTGPAPWANSSGAASWGDISLLEGCDGAALLASTDGSGVVTGFSYNIVLGAPQGALAAKSDGSAALGKTVGEQANAAAMAWELGLLSPITQAFIVNAYKPVIATLNGRWEITVFEGTY